MFRIGLALFLCLAVSAAFAADEVPVSTCAEIAAMPLLAEGETRPACVTGHIQSVSFSNVTYGRLSQFVIYAVTDATGGAFVRALPHMNYDVGDIVVMRGVVLRHAGSGNTLAPKTMSKIGHADVSSVKAKLRQVNDGVFNFRTVSVSGTVIDAFRDELDPRYVWILLCDGEAMTPLAFHDESSAPGDLVRLVNCQVSATGLCRDSAGGRRFIGSMVQPEDMDAIKVTRGPPADLFDVLRLDPQEPVRPTERRGLSGRVLAHWDEGRMFVLTKDGRAVEVWLRGDCALPAVGDAIRVSGFAEPTAFFVRLVQAVWRKTNEPDLPEPRPSNLNFRRMLTDDDGKQKINPDAHGAIIRLEGVVKNVSSLQSRRKFMYLDCQGVLIRTDVSALSDEQLNDLEVGSRLAVTGLCLLEFDSGRPFSGSIRLKGLSLLVRTRDDIVVLQTPPWWTPARLMVVIGILLAIILAIGIWNRALKVLSERRGRELMAEQLNRASADLKVGERTRLAVELHDALSQNLTGVSLQLDAVKRFADEDRGKMARHLDMAMRTLKSCRDELRNCLWDLRNRALEETDMNEAIRRTASPFVGDAALLIRFNVPRDQISDNTAHALMRIIRELATNAVRHGAAKTIRIAGALENGRLFFSVSDNGGGFDPQRHPGVDEGHFGLDGIRERISRFDGTLEIESAPDRGSTIRISMTA